MMKGRTGFRKQEEVLYPTLRHRSSAGRTRLFGHKYLLPSCVEAGRLDTNLQTCGLQGLLLLFEAWT